MGEEREKKCRYTGVCMMLASEKTIEAGDAWY
jgi:hypothetical protein